MLKQTEGLKKKQAGAWIIVKKLSYCTQYIIVSIKTDVQFLVGKYKVNSSGA